MGPFTRLEISAARVVLEACGDSGDFQVFGHDADGCRRPVSPSEVRLDYDETALRIEPAADGYSATALRAPAAVGVAVHAEADPSAYVAVVAGLRRESVADFDDGWTCETARATATATPQPGPHGPGLRLDYDFSASTATRTASAVPSRPLAVAGQPRAFEMWIHGAGSGEWPSLECVDARDVSIPLRGEHVTWHGWRRVRFDVPDDVAFPLTLRRAYLAETDPGAAYRGRVVLAELVAVLPPTARLPRRPRPAEPLSAATVDDRALRFAVLSDAQFTAAEPDGPIVASARRMLRRLKSRRPEFLLVNGDFVDEGAREDLALARRILAEELGDELEWVYVPGNHEVMGGRLADFVAEFGPARRVFDRRGVRFITLDTSALRLGDEQLEALRRRLREAADDASVGAAIVVAHVPPRDPTGRDDSRLADRAEAAALEGALADFGRSTGKGVAFVGGHAGVFANWLVDGVAYVVNGNSGKAPADSAERGGRIGWTECGVDPPDV
ncbi:MAG: metallophosphoesterase family protein, partial [Stackebrandtia sp.]